MKIKETFRVSFKSKKDDRGDYQFCITARNSDKALNKILEKINSNREFFKGLTDDYYMLYEDLEQLREKVYETDDKERRKYYYAHCPSVDLVGFAIERL